MILSRRFTYAGNVAWMRNVYTILARKPQGKRSLRRPRFRQDENINMKFDKQSVTTVTQFNLSH
jgi:hypothetical protein